MDTNAFFTRRDTANASELFLPTPHARGPWHPGHCHAGPPTGLIARAFERLLPTKRLTRITVNLARPIPFAGFYITTDVIREGRTVALVAAQITDQSGTVVVTAEGLLMAPQPHREVPTQDDSIGHPDTALPGSFPIDKTLHGLPAFNGDGVQAKYPAGHDARPGRTIAWLRTVPLLLDESPSPFQRICPLADCGNAFGRNADPRHTRFANTDLTVVLHRDPEGDWFGTDSRGFWQSDGIGLADARLFDARGAVGHALQTLLLLPGNAGG